MSKKKISAGPSWVKTQEGQHLKGRRSRDTKPEIRLRHAVHRLGLRYRLHRQVAPRCTADFVLPRHRIAVFVDGCFWHGCPTHGVSAFRGPNAERWAEKIAANKARDQRNTAAAEAAGWLVVRVWECEVRTAPDRAALRILQLSDRAREDGAQSR
ncbi:very short patch repair endonuclease [Streptomyces gilvifuscus]|uniref:Very short patch repair endonuclease n=1 Tax=Streptomyces gilvifuscus TaxID=1550617 RepID=A0ABT5G182_9ACTN|nr:very short patch repair endonuclease [Streptomyces gilvifuscus]MDC2958535.1 very short patch repair endonuclease [Streptomyces gilvifuscus]